MLSKKLGNKRNFIEPLMRFVRVTDVSPARANTNGNLLPPVTSLRDVSAAVAMAVALQAHNEGLTEGINADEIEGLIRAHIWVPRYLPYRRVNKP